MEDEWLSVTGKLGFDKPSIAAESVRASMAGSVASPRTSCSPDEFSSSVAAMYRVASTSYSLGGSSTLEVIAARTALLSAESQLADALAAANSARADLDRALGAPATTIGTGNR